MEREGHVRANGDLLRIRGLTKDYPGVRALDHVDLDVYSGEIHCLVGENGAGKSTLIEIIGGALKRDEGVIELEGTPVNFNSPKEAQDSGIAVLHQELPVLPEMTVAENIFLSRLPRTKLGTISYPALYKKAREELLKIDSDIDPRAILGELPVAKQQLVSIAKALSLNAKIIIFDEPSAVLTMVELKKLFEVIRGLREEGKGIIYISHRLDEIFEIGDRVTVLCNGKRVVTDFLSKLSKPELIQYMVGHRVVEQRLREESEGVTSSQVLLEVQNVSRGGVLKNVSFKLYRGEVLGIFGLVGSGRTELARAIIGADKVDSGCVLVGGKVARIKSPKKAIQYGICLAPEDRKQQGLFLDKSVRVNIAIPGLQQLSRFRILVNNRQIAELSRKYIQSLKIVTPSGETIVRNLSGGNQQKVVLSKWLSVEATILIFDEPTRGIDVGAKEEIRKVIVGLASQGKGIIVISSEIGEILAVSDRIVVMHEGRITADIPVEEATQEKLIAYAMGGM